MRTRKPTPRILETWLLPTQIARRKLPVQFFHAVKLICAPQSSSIGRRVSFLAEGSGFKSRDQIFKFFVCTAHLWISLLQGQSGQRLALKALKSLQAARRHPDAWTLAPSPQPIWGFRAPLKVMQVFSLVVLVNANVARMVYAAHDGARDCARGSKKFDPSGGSSFWRGIRTAMSVRSSSPRLVFDANLTALALPPTKLRPAFDRQPGSIGNRVSILAEGRRFKSRVLI